VLDIRQRKKLGGHHGIRTRTVALAAWHSFANHYSACDFHASLDGCPCVSFERVSKPAICLMQLPGKSREELMLGTILIIILILLLIGALPTWPYSAGWGYYPGGGLGLVLIVVVVLILLGRI
jgi:Protein of unknown function (DUF3309)